MICIRPFMFTLLASTVAALPALANPKVMMPPVVVTAPPPVVVPNVSVPIPRVDVATGGGGGGGYTGGKIGMIVPSFGAGAPPVPPSVKADVDQAASRSNDIAAERAKLERDAARAGREYTQEMEKIRASETKSQEGVNALDMGRVTARRDYDSVKAAYEADPTPANGKAKEDAERKLINANDAYDKADASYRDLSNKNETAKKSVEDKYRSQYDKLLDRSNDLTGGPPRILDQITQIIDK
jgi:hypothetical protein